MQSSFTNYDECVHLEALGTSVVLPTTARRYPAKRIPISSVRLRAGAELTIGAYLGFARPELQTGRGHRVRFIAEGG
jgi:hypothetical protein